MKHYRTFLTAFFLLAGLALQAQVINKSITIQQADSLIKMRINDSSLVVLDIRTDMEFASGHLENAVQISFIERSGKKKIWMLDRNKAYLVYCRSGKRSKSALDMMKDRKFKEVYNMLGGIKAWKKEGYYVAKEKVTEEDRYKSKTKK
jgi:rhodanese-related sulfurtransferase